MHGVVVMVKKRRTAKNASFCLFFSQRTSERGNFHRLYLAPWYSPLSKPSYTWASSVPYEWNSYTFEWKSGEITLTYIFAKSWQHRATTPSDLELSTRNLNTRLTNLPVEWVWYTQQTLSAVMSLWGCVYLLLRIATEVNTYLSCSHNVPLQM